MADINTYPEPRAAFSGDALLPEPPSNRPQPNYGPKVAPSVRQAPNADPYGEDYDFWQQGLSPVKLSVQTQLILAAVIVTIIVTFAVIFV